MTDAELQVQIEWHEKLLDGERAYSAASAEVKRLMVEYRDIPPADRGFAFQQAVRTETAALADYNRILRVFTHLVLYGVLPGDSQEKIA